MVPRIKDEDARWLKLGLASHRVVLADPSKLHEFDTVEELLEYLDRSHKVST